MEVSNLSQQSKRKLPDKIKINWRTYKILKKDTVRGGDNYIGTALQGLGEIEIKKDQEHGTERVTLLHEIFHCILYFAGNELQKNEDFMEMLSNNVYQVLKDNPELVRYLLDEKEKAENEG